MLRKIKSNGNLVSREPMFAAFPPRFTVETSIGPIDVFWVGDGLEIYRRILTIGDFDIGIHVDRTPNNRYIRGGVCVENNHEWEMSKLERYATRWSACGYTDAIPMGLLEYTFETLVEELGPLVDRVIEDTYDRKDCLGIAHWNHYDDAGFRDDFHREDDRLRKNGRKRR